MKNRIDCQVTDCIYNEKKVCTKVDVKIGGSNATQPVQTSCDSFEPNKSLGGFTSSKEQTTSGGDCSRIVCEATDCRHNKSRECDLDCVKVDCTCQPQTCSATSETFCDSFRERA